MCCADLRGEIINFAVRCGVLQQGTKKITVADLFSRVADDHLISKMAGTCAYHIQCLRQNTLINKKPHAFVSSVDALEHRHGLCRRCGFIQQGGIGQLHTGQVTDHMLKIQHGFQPAL